MDENLLNKYCDMIIKIAPYSRDFTKSGILQKLEYDEFLDDKNNINAIYDKLIQEGYLIQVPNKNPVWVQMTQKGIDKKFNGHDPENYTIDRILNELYQSPNNKLFYTDLLDGNGERFDLYKGTDMSKILSYLNLIIWNEGEQVWLLSTLARSIVKEGGYLAYLERLRIKRANKAKAKKKAEIESKTQRRWSNVERASWVFGIIAVFIIIVNLIPESTPYLGFKWWVSLFK